jgi:hypothetical protein
MRQGQMPRLAILCGLIALAGCTSVPPVAPPPRAPTPHEAIAFGRILVMEGPNQVPYGESTKLYPGFTIVRVEDGAMFTVALAQDGTFFAVLPRGAYAIAEVARSYRVPLAFTVPADADAADLGRLELHVVRERGLFGGWFRADRLELKDEGEAARRLLAERVPWFQGRLVTSLIVNARQVPGAPQRLAERRRRDGLTAGDVLQAIIIGL